MYLWKKTYLGLRLVLCACCLIIVSSCGQLDRVKDIATQLPMPPDSVLLEEKSGTNGALVAKCASVSIQQLFGTNGSDLEGVIDYYKSSLDPNTWTVHSEGPKSITLVMDEPFVLEISGDRLWISVLTDAAVEFDGQYSTIYIVRVVAPRRSDVSKEECT
ncbi:MAG: hypothetical protein KDD92_07965 [Caldilineaceae bacterium]|nr:hypothetical protein [Caldilineaceae bacterium]